MTPPAHEITQLLIAWNNGDDSALEELLPLVYEELHRLAKAYLGHEHPGHTLQTTDLINEAFIRLIDCRGVKWQNRAHFFGISAKLMRRILVDHARSRHYAKRGGLTVRVTLKEAAELAFQEDADLVALEDALVSLEAIAPRQSRVVELRYFGGLSIEETAEALGVSPTTVKQDWSLAQAWLYRELSRKG